MNSHGVLKISVLLYMCMLVACDAIDCVQTGDNISVNCKGDFAKFPANFSISRKEPKGIIAKCTEGYELRYAQSSGISRCYKFVKKRMTYEKSKKVCHADGASLVTIRNSEENFYVGELAERMSWQNSYVRIGLTRGNQSSKEWVWDDGTPVNYTKWLQFEPNNSTYENSSGESCVEALSFRWLDFWCGRESSFICEKTATYVPIHKCDQGYEMRHIATTGITRCYRFSTTKKSFADARKDCMQEGAHVAVIRNTEENWFLSRHTEHWDIRRYYIKYTFEDGSEESLLAIYLGYTKRSDDTWQWDVALNDTFKYWQTGYLETYDVKTLKSCTVLIAHHLYFYVSCDLPRYYVCEKIAH